MLPAKLLSRGSGSDMPPMHGRAIDSRIRIARHFWTLKNLETTPLG